MSFCYLCCVTGSSVFGDGWMDGWMDVRYDNLLELSFGGEVASRM